MMSVLRGTAIAVDLWSASSAKLFFLSHAHSDHTKGLTSKWNSNIYTSPITARIIQHKLKFNPKVIKTLEVGQTHTIVIGSDIISVRLIDANHCPGAVMFVFEGVFGTILHTGDFRFTREMNIPSDVDILYLDNTYCDPKCEFKPREQAITDIIGIIAAHINEHKIVIGMRYLGKEELLIKIAKYFRKPICVDAERFKLLKILRLEKVFTTDQKETNIQVIPFLDVTSKHVKIWNKTCPTIAILPTSLFTGMKSNNFTGQKRIFVVPYSDHSSFTELKEFVQMVRPKMIYPIVTKVKRRSDMNVFGPVGVCGNRVSEKSSVKIVQKGVVYQDNIVEADCEIRLPEKRPVKIVQKGVVYHDTDLDEDGGDDVEVTEEVVNPKNDFLVNWKCKTRQFNDCVQRLKQLDRSLTSPVDILSGKAIKKRRCEDKVIEVITLD